MKTFTKIRKWANEVGAVVKDATYRDNIIYIELPNGKKFEVSQRESTVYRSCRGGMKGNAKGLYFLDVPKKGWGGYAFQEPSQVVCIEKMSKYL